MLSVLNHQSEKDQGMYRPQIGEVYVEPNIAIEGVDLESWIILSILDSHSVEMAVLMLKYLRNREKASTAFDKLEQREWSDCVITTKTKLSLYEV